MHRILVTGLALLGLVALPAFAEDPAPKHDPKAAFAEADKNADGRIDRAEFHDRVVEIFFFGDADKDGSLSEAEVVAVVVVEGDFEAADRNDDGRLTLYEFIDQRFTVFETADADGDGLLSVEEVVEAYEVED